VSVTRALAWTYVENLRKPQNATDIAGTSGAQVDLPKIFNGWCCKNSCLFNKATTNKALHKWLGLFAADATGDDYNVEVTA
jgi:hypothetical protein